MSKQVLVVFGATGNQGGSVVRAVLNDATLSNQFQIRGITRDASKPAAQKLTSQGVEMVSADLGSPDTVAAAVQGAHTVFLVTDFWATMSAETEVAQGKTVTDASKAAGVKHIIFSSLINTTKATEGRLSNIHHFVSKNDVEQYIKASGIPATFYLPAQFMQNYTGMIRKNEDGSGFVLNMAIDGDKSQIPLIDVVADTGLYVKAAIKGFPSKTGTLLYGAEAYYTPNELMKEFSEAIGKPAEYQRVPVEVFKSFLPPAAAVEMAENMQLSEDVGYYAGAELGETLALLEGEPKKWRDFVAENKEKWLQ